jgi:hypothetical protein
MVDKITIPATVQPTKYMTAKTPGIENHSPFPKN